MTLKKLFVPAVAVATGGCFLPWVQGMDAKNTMLIPLTLAKVKENK
jgi:hypothetical protein